MLTDSFHYPLKEEGSKYKKVFTIQTPFIMEGYELAGNICYTHFPEAKKTILEVHGEFDWQLEPDERFHMLFDLLFSGMWTIEEVHVEENV